ncbi:MAG TPA: hypothetical protein VMJ32_10060 [Pirellulales bacterium]|nr:hypothetical protein [Pirellulales bacterium]
MPYAKSNGSEMTCATFKSRLNAVLDERRSPQLDLLLCAHARSCPECDQLLSTQMSLFETLPNTREEPSPDFALRVMQAVDVQRREQKRWRLRASAVVAIAAALLIAVISWRGPAAIHEASNGPSETQPQKLTAEVLKRVDRVAEDFKPVTGSVYTAFNAFWLANRFL